MNNEEISGLPSDLQLPVKLNIIPLAGRPIFPGIFTPLMINATEDVKVAEKACESDGYFGLVLLKNEAENPTMADLYDVGTLAHVIKKVNLPDGGINTFVSTIKRFKIKKTLSSQSPMLAAVEYLDDIVSDSFEIKALTRAVISEIKDIAEYNPMISDEIRHNLVNIDQPSKIADYIASFLNIDKKEQQKILEILDVKKRLEQVMIYIKKEQEISRVQRKIQKQINDNIEKNQRDFFLREELKNIQEELGVNSAGGKNDYSIFKEKIDSFNFTGEVKEAAYRELERFHILDPHDPEYTSSRNYLDLLVNLPWNDEPKENYTLSDAEKILNRDHYGLEEVKKRILEFLSVRKFKNDGKGSVLILSGPPGVGKTSIGHSIADAMKKPFFRFSVGGESDASKIKGHRRTYVASMPGEILKGLQITKSRSPVFMIDEVDKMNSSYQGNPAAALLEVLDPEQNATFRDTYLDLPFDLSNVFFILTANTLDTIPLPLLDRAEIIELSGYIDQEKIEIARKYLLPKNLKKNGFKKNQVKFTPKAFSLITKEYAREAGVRNFEKCIDKINRKLVKEELALLEADKSLGITAENESEILQKALASKTFTIDESEVRKYLGKAVFDESQIKTASLPGTAIGLAWTSMGGDTLLLEAVSFESEKAGLVLTGQMGDVMKESAQIAMNVAKIYAIEHGIKDAAWFEKNTIHLHIPEGATPKDGPSAGITMCTCFLSLLKNQKIKADTAMTGELSLTGQVLPIGGLREKTVAAKRNKIKTIIIPKANEKDLEEIPEIVRKGIKFIPVSYAKEVLDIIF